MKIFALEFAGPKTNFRPSKLLRKKLTDLRQKSVTKKYLLALSGGSDSSTVAYF